MIDARVPGLPRSFALHGFPLRLRSTQPVSPTGFITEASTRGELPDETRMGAAPPCHEPPDPGALASPAPSVPQPGGRPQNAMGLRTPFLLADPQLRAAHGLCVPGHPPFPVDSMRVHHNLRDPVDIGVDPGGRVHTPQPPPGSVAQNLGPHQPPQGHGESVARKGAQGVHRPVGGERRRRA